MRGDDIRNTPANEPPPAAWRVVEGPHESRAWHGPTDLQIVWTWKLERTGGDALQIAVETNGARLDQSGLPTDAREALETRGLSAVRAVLAERAPPARLLVSELGVTRRRA